MLLCVVCLIKRIRRCVESDSVGGGGVGCHGGDVVSISFWKYFRREIVWMALEKS